MAAAQNKGRVAEGRHIAPSTSVRLVPGKRTRGRRIVGTILKTVLCLLVTTIIAVGLFGYTQYKAAMRTADTLKADAAQLMTGIATLQDQVTARDFKSAQDTLGNVSSRLAHMKGILSAEEFDFAAKVPKYGGDISNLRLLLSVLEELCDEAISPLLQSLSDSPLSSLYSKEHGINVPALYALLDTVDPVIPLVQAKLAELDALPDFVIPQLRDMIEPAMAKVGAVDELLRSYSATFASLKSIAHALLGQDGNKVFLIAAQNNAEMRSTGGFPGAVGRLTIANGKPGVSDFGSVVDYFAEFVTYDYGITQEEMAISRGKMEWTRGAGYQPDFCRAAEIWARAYEEKTGIRVDGVIALTPSTVQHVLALTGPITLSDGTELNGDNATRVLLSDLYWTYLQTSWEYRRYEDYVDSLFSEAAHKAFKAFMDCIDLSSFQNLQELLDVAVTCFEKHEALIWLADEDDQAAIAPLHCSGIENQDPETPVTGIFFNTYIASKTGWYLDQTIEVGEGVSNPDGTTSYPVKCIFANIVTPEEGRSGGTYIMGPGTAYWDYVRDGYMKPIIMLWAPCGGTISDIHDNVGATWREVVYEGNQLFYEYDTIIAPQNAFEVTYTVTVSAEATAPLTYWTQPTLTEYR